MKRLFALMLTACLLASVALAEGGDFSLRGVEWGMTRQEVLDIENNPRAETDAEGAFVEVEYEAIEAYGARADLEYYFLGDSLAAARLEFDDAADFEAVRAQVAQQYGAPIEADTLRWEVLETILESEYEDRQTSAFCNWELADGTYIVLAVPADDDDAFLGFWNETTFYGSCCV